MRKPPGRRHLPVTEIRDFGDEQSIVLFTRDNYTYRRFREWALCSREVTYTAGVGGSTVAADLYFPRPVEPLLRRLVGLPGKRRKTPRQRALEHLSAVGLQRRLPGFS